MFKSMHKNIETEYGFRIRKYRLDGEFQKGEVDRFLKKHHIATEPTPPYHHYMKGVAERGMRTVREKANPTMQEKEVMRRNLQLFDSKTKAPNNLHAGKSMALCDGACCLV